MTRQFTGRHMALILIAFFETIVAVNMTMAVLATRTFGGKVVENSYVASQKFNSWLSAARAQEQLGWAVDARVDEARRVRLGLSKGGAPLAGAAASGFARHPLGRAADVQLGFVPGADGELQSTRALPPGRWQVYLHIERGADEARLIEILS